MDLFWGLSASSDGMLLSLLPGAWESVDSNGPDIEEAFLKPKEFNCPKPGDADVPVLMSLKNKFGIGAVADPLLLENRFVEGFAPDAL
jgi:hypothetical protein